MRKMTRRPLHLLLLIVCVVGSSVGDEVEFDEGTKKIDLSSSGIKSVSLDFSQYPELEEVDLSNNDIAAVEPDAFSSNQRLKSINLSGNRALELGVPFLETTAAVLNLSACGLEKLPVGTFDGMKGLEVLDLSGNPLKFGSGTVFRHPPKKIVVSSIEDAELKALCEDIDSQFVVLGRRKTVQCKDVRKKMQVNGAVGKGEKLDATDGGDVQIDIIEEGYMKETHMEEEMLSDQPMDGSGDGEEEIKTDEEPAMTTQEDEVVTDTEEPEDTTEVEDSAEQQTDIFGDEADSVFGAVANVSNEDSASSKEEEGGMDVSADKPDESEAEVEVPGAPEKEAETVKTRASDKTSVKADLVDNPAIGENKVETSGGSNVVLILIVAVVVVGSALVGFRYWKSRRSSPTSKTTYSAVNGDNPTDGKELKEIKVVENEPSSEFVPLVDKAEPELKAVDVIANSRADIPNIDEEEDGRQTKE